MATDLGLVGIVNKGPYNSTMTYYQGNFVYNPNNNSTWILKAVSATGSEPTENNTDWQLLAKGIIPQAFTGATSSANGVMGQVPGPLIADVGKFLNADGTWKNVPNPQTMTGATDQTAGTGGLTPTPAAGDQDNFLAGDGTYKQDARVGALSSLTTTEKNTLVGAINEVDSHADATATAIAKCECLVLTASAVSALPYTFSNAAIETDMVCINSVLSNPSAQLSDWTVNTDTAGKATVSGTISGSTNITLYLTKSR